MLGVHESSVKRWCNANELEFWLTPGGHRRIPIHALVRFANTQRIDLYLRHFGADAGEVWALLDQIKQKTDFNGLVALCYRWIQQSEIARMTYLMTHLVNTGYSVGMVFDYLVGPVMSRVGVNYFEGNLTIGDEHRMTQVMRDILVTLSTTSALKLKEKPETPPVAIVGCARGEVHELGALMVRVLLEAMGWKIVYLGLNVPTEEFAHQQLKHGAALVCISLMPPMGIPEAHAMIRLLDRIYDKTLPYRLILGGSALGNNTEPAALITRIPDVKLFSRMAPFQDWLGNVPPVLTYSNGSSN